MYLYKWGYACNEDYMFAVFVICIYMHLHVGVRGGREVPPNFQIFL